MSDPVPGAARVLFFAAARDAAGTAQADVPVPEAGVAVEAFAREIAARYPALAPYMRSLRLAVNGEYAAAGTLVRAGDEVAIIPPVAGG